MTLASIAISFEFAQLSYEIDGVPEKHPIKILTPNGPDQSFDKRVRGRDVGNRLDLINLENAQVCEPPVKAKERIVVRAEACR